MVAGIRRVTQLNLNMYSEATRGFLVDLLAHPTALQQLTTLEIAGVPPHHLEACARLPCLTELIVGLAFLHSAAELLSCRHLKVLRARCVSFDW